MNKINFNSPYSKLLDFSGNVVKEAKLLWAFPVEISKVPREFIRYDTHGGNYKFEEKGKYILLVFEKIMEGKGKNLFVTLRKFTPEKLNFYEQRIGSVFKVNVK